MRKVCALRGAVRGRLCVRGSGVYLFHSVFVRWARRTISSGSVDGDGGGCDGLFSFPHLGREKYIHNSEIVMYPSN